jgi:taurine dioxygenase
MSFKTRPLSENFGLEILDADIANIDDAGFQAIRGFWQQDPLLLIRRQNPTNEEFIDFSRRFGALDIVIGGRDPDDRHPELLFVSNLLRNDGSVAGGLGNAELVWHTDQIYREKPASGSIFYGVEMPTDAGNTSFCNMALAYETLPAALKAQLDGKRASCHYGAGKPLSTYMERNLGKTYRRGLSEDQVKKVENRTPAVSHDMTLESPVTGQRSLYFSPNHTTEIEGLSEEEGRTLIDALLDHALQKQHVHTHHWRNGDVIFWDNARLLHRRDKFPDAFPRFAKRTTIFMDPAHFAVPEPHLPYPELVQEYLRAS